MPFDLFLKIPNIPGESVVAAHANEIDGISISWGIRTPVDAAGQPPLGPAQFDLITITKLVERENADGDSGHLTFAGTRNSLESVSAIQ